MKNLSIRLKITLWFTVTMIIVVIFAYQPSDFDKNNTG